MEDLMNRGRLFPLTRAFAVGIAGVLLAVFTATTRAADPPQKKEKAKSASTASSSKNNEEYGAKIKEYTTEKYFLT